MTMLTAYRAQLYRRSRQIPGFLSSNLTVITAAWIAIAGLAGLVRLLLLASPVHSVFDTMPVLVAYSAVILAPILGFKLAASAFDPSQDRRPLDFHLSFFGKWRRIDQDDASRLPLFGPFGFLASLVIGLMLNVVVRTGEYFVAVPAMSLHAPDWALTLFAVMTVDLVIMNFFYMVVFVMAVRSVPLFPRMLLFVWLMDIVMQLVIAKQMASVPTLPSEVITPLASLLQGNVTKVLISVGVWLPYLILSERVNLTYRSRLPA